MPKHYETIKSLGACTSGLDWLKEQGETWYDDCERVDWLVWLATKLFDCKRVVLYLCEIVEPMQKYDESGKGQILIDTVRAWCNGKATIREVEQAAVDAGNVARAAARVSSDAIVARAAAARVADCADDIAAADIAAAFAAAAAAFAAAAAESVEAAAFAKPINTIRKHFPWAEVEAKLKELKKGI